jgi:hypothetical protein
VGPGTIADPLAMPQPRRSFTAAPAEAARYPHQYQPGPCRPSKVPAMPVSVANELRLIDHGQAFDRRIRFRRNQRLEAASFNRVKSLLEQHERNFARFKFKKMAQREGVFAK